MSESLEARLTTAFFEEESWCKRQMKQHEVTVPQIGLIAGTRAMLGAGIALLLSEKLTAEQRRAIGWTLVAVGALTTIPLVLQLFSEDE